MKQMKHLFLPVLLFTVVTFQNCSSNENKTSEKEIKDEAPVLVKTGMSDVEDLFNHLNKNVIKLNTTTKEELSAMYDVEVNDYYMSKKIELEDHTLYITFTILDGVLSKISYATLSNTRKDFSYINDLVMSQFGLDYSQTFNTTDSTDDNSIINWTKDSQNIQFESFSGLNSGYELTIK